MSKEKLQKKVTDFFKIEPKRKEVFATSDNFLFTAKQDALNHAKTLKVKKVETFYKSKKAEDIDVTSTEIPPKKVVKFNDAEVALAKAIKSYNAIEGIDKLNGNTGVAKVQTAIDSLDEENSKVFEANLTTE